MCYSTAKTDDHAELQTEHKTCSNQTILVKPQRLVDSDTLISECAFRRWREGTKAVLHIRNKSGSDAIKDLLSALTCNYQSFSFNSTYAIV